MNLEALLSNTSTVVRDLLIEFALSLVAQNDECTREVAALRARLNPKIHRPLPSPVPSVTFLIAKRRSLYTVSELLEFTSRPENKCANREYCRLPFGQFVCLAEIMEYFRDRPPTSVMVPKWVGGSIQVGADWCEVIDFNDSDALDALWPANLLAERKRWDDLRPCWGIRSRALAIIECARKIKSRSQPANRSVAGRARHKSAP